jgi:bacterioferritin-associated ferredoxin
MQGKVRRLLCLCNSIFEHEVVACIRKGARSVDEVGEQCDAGTGCGSCRGTIKTMIEEEDQRRRAGLALPDALLQLPLFARRKS